MCRHVLATADMCSRAQPSGAGYRFPPWVSRLELSLEQQVLLHTEPSYLSPDMFVGNTLETLLF